MGGTEKMSESYHWNFKDPINLLTYPFMKHYEEERRRANARKLRPTKKPTPAQQPSTVPAYSESNNLMTERMRRCMDSQRGIRR